MKTTNAVLIEVDHGSETIDVSFYGDVLIVDNGIGPYEFQGYKGYDIRKEVELQSIWWDRDNHQKPENESIELFLKKHYDVIKAEIEENTEIYDLDDMTADPDEIYESRRDR